MVKKYKIILKSQLGPKYGSLRIRASDERLLGVLELLGHKSLLVGGTQSGGVSFEFKGKMWTPLGKAECLINGDYGERSITGMLNIHHHNYALSGKEEEKGDRNGQ